MRIGVPKEIKTNENRIALVPAGAEALADAYRRYRHRIHRQNLAGEPALAPRADYADLVALVTAAWHRVFG